MALDLRSTSMNQPPCDSDLTMDPNTKLHQSADKTEVKSPVPMSKQGEKKQSAAGSSTRRSCPLPGAHQPIQKRSVSLGTTNDDFPVFLDPNTKFDKSVDKTQDTSVDNILAFLDPNTKLNRSADKTQVKSPVPMSKQGEKKQSAAGSSTRQSLPRSVTSQSIQKRSASLDDFHLTLDENTRQDEDKTEAASHFTPELFNESGAISYRFTCPGPGVFWCDLTKLVFTMDQEGELSYRTVRWDENLLKLNGKRPAGPLFDIKCSEDAVSRLHFPHCEIKPALLCLSVVHISDDGMSILQPLEITDTHVVVDVPHLSAFGLLRETTSCDSPNPEPIRGQVLLFHRPAYMNQSPNLNVFLLPDNMPVQEVKGQHENAEHIVTPSSCELIEGQTYSLHCSEAKKVQPESARFDLNYGPNYHPTFEIRLSSSTNEATVIVQDQEERRVWEYQAELPGLGPRRENLQKTRILSGDEERMLFSVRKKFIDSVSSSVLKDLLDTLLQHGVINSGEMESIQVLSSRADKARELIDTVRKKGKQACKILIDTFCEVDPFVSDMMGLKQ